jgi:hypothetical protein
VRRRRRDDFALSMSYPIQSVLRVAGRHDDVLRDKAADREDPQAFWFRGTIER